MALEVKWTQRASGQLDENKRYISADRPDAANREVLAIIERTEILPQFPETGSVFRRAPEAVYRELVVGNYRVFYVVKREIDRIDIVTVWHGARGEPILS